MRLATQQLPGGHARCPACTATVQRGECRRLPAPKQSCCMHAHHAVLCHTVPCCAVRYGTDAYLHLNRLGNDEEPLPGEVAGGRPLWEA